MFFASAALDIDTFQTLSDTYAAALAEVGDTPGEVSSTVRAYASLLENELDNSHASAGEIELYQVCALAFGVSLAYVGEYEI